MSQSKAPLVTDLTALIRGASEKPAPVVIGDKPEVVEQNKASAGQDNGKLGISQAAQASGKKQEKKGQGRAPAKETYPWEDVNPKIKMFVQVRAPESLVKKYDYILAHTLGGSGRHEILLEALESGAEKMLAEIKKNGYR